jgi:hypothetical protein
MFPFIMALILSHDNGMPQALNGTTGLVTIPTADIASDGNFIFGFSLLDKRFNEYWPGKYHQSGYFLTAGYLPFIEVSFRLTRSFGAPKGTHGLGDRMTSIRFKLTGESAHFPSIALGIHDVLSALESTEAIRHNALYLVASKRWTRTGFPLRLGAHLGFGADWMKARRHEFVGPFGGISLEHRSGCALLAEHDTEKVNAGLRFRLFGRVQILLALMRLESFSGAVSYQLALEH